MVNYRRVLCEVALVGALVVLTAAAPASEQSHNIHYDQRQNGTENYRINIDGIVVAVAPAESLVSALGNMDDFMDLLSLEDYFSSSSSSSSLSPSVPVSIENEKPLVKPQEKPDVKPSEDKEKPSEGKPQEVKPQEEKPVVPAKPAESSLLSDVSLGDDLNIQKKEVSKKQDKSKRLKNRLVSFLMPLLRKTRHH